MSRRCFFASSEIRAFRQAHGYTLERVALEAGTTLPRASIVERFPDQANPGEIEALRRAILALSGPATDDTAAEAAR